MTMLKTLKALILNTLTTVNVVIVVLLAASGYADHVNPAQHPVLANAGLLFPVFLVLNTAMLLLWVAVAWRRAWLPVAGYLLVSGSIRVYLPLNPRQAPPEGALKIVSFNVWRFAEKTNDEAKVKAVIDYLAQSRADIICLQESGPEPRVQQKVNAVLDSLYPYKNQARWWQNGLAFYSRHPIADMRRINYESNTNGSIAYWVVIDSDTCLFVNNHLESYGITEGEKDGFEKMVKGSLGKQQARRESHQLLDKLAMAARLRGPQADTLAQFVKSHKDLPLIFCGDFNDNPISYTRRTIARELNDCYVQTASGPGFSYHKGGMFVRIDNMLCSDHWQPYACHIDSKIDASDHYPIVCWVKKRPKH